MTIKEAAERYRIPTEILDEYESWGFCGNNDGNIGVRQYDQTDIERLSLIMTLHDIGFANSETETYMKLLVEDEDGGDQRLNMLEQKRKGILDEIHFREKQLNHLDYLRYSIRKGQRQTTEQE